MNKLLTNPKLKIVGIVLVVLILLIALLLKTGNLKVKLTTNQPGSAPTGSPPSGSSSKGDLASRSISFGGTDSKPEFSINPPSGWMRGDSEEGSDLAIGSSVPDTLSNGQDFTPNVIISIGLHRFGEKSIEDYVNSWDQVVIGYLPSVQFLKTYQASVNGLKAYVQDRLSPRPDGEKIRQLHYKFYVDQYFTMAVTASAPESSWAKHEASITAAIESIKLTRPSTSAPETSAESDEFTTYESALKGVSIDYPTVWEKKEGYNDALVVFSSPTRDNLSIIIQGDGSQDLTLQDYTDLSLGQLEELGATSLESAEATVSGLPAYQVNYIVNDTIKLWQLWTVKDNLAYLLTYTARVDNFDAYLETVQRMLESFKID